MAFLRAFVFFIIGVAAVALVMMYVYKPGAGKPKTQAPVAGARPAPVENFEPTQLIAGLSSGMGLERALKTLGVNPGDMEHAGGARLASGETAAPKGPYKLALDGFEHNGFSGEIVLVFHDDRLTAVLFYPLDMEAYFDAMKRDGTDIRLAREMRFPLHTLVWTEADPTGRRHVGWADERLAPPGNRGG